MLEDCTLCPRNCHVNRNINTGVCGASNKLVIARASLHYWEEPCISGDVGSGTIFFSNCNLKCIFCQNSEISSKGFGKEVTIERFSEICLELQDKGALNINLVTPTHYVPLIIDGLKMAKKNGLSIPIVYNTSSYENVDTIKSLNGLIDIYLPDLKYYSDEYSLKYSKAPNYFLYASKAIDEMLKQVGSPIFDDNGIMKKGVIVRHLLLPGLSNDSKKILNYLYNKYNDNIYISIMNQYTPIKNFEFDNLNHTISDKTYDNIINYALDLGIKNAFIQEGKTCSESFIPIFDNTGV